MFYLLNRFIQIKILLNNDDLIEALKNVKNLGFVPTMGSLHKGHISLIKKCKKQCKNIIVSIFVNPNQFNNKKDFDTYPRKHKKDKILCAKFRKGHFEGVIDVMDRLTRLIKPNKIFMGEKDFQQLILVKKYIEKKYKTLIIPCKTIRDKNKLPLSSRNSHLNINQLKRAGKLSQYLINFKKRLPNKGKNINNLIKQKKKELLKLFNVRLEYLE